MDYRIEAITLPVSDCDRAKAFYEKAGWNLDLDTEPSPGFRIIQFTPPGSAASITFGTGTPQSEPGSYVNTYLVVTDIEAARAELVGRGVDVGEIRHMGPDGWQPGVDPEHRDYWSYADFSDPDGNTWVLQESNRYPS